MHNTITAAAGSVAAALSTALLGRQVITQKWGLFQGGLCTVIELHPDENAPEIVLQVRHDETGEEVGIFADEMICLVCESSRAVMIETAAILKVWEQARTPQQQYAAKFMAKNCGSLGLIGGAA